MKRLCCRPLVFAPLVLVMVLGAAASRGQVPLAAPGTAERFAQLETLPRATQRGPSCAFFANVPALSMATGINIADGSPDSQRFIAAVYGLRRGDFRFERSFDKAVFFALFGLQSEETTVYHPEGGRTARLPAASRLLDTTLGDALDAGRPVSIRVVGAFGGNHNVLLLGRNGNRFLYHDPFPGTIKNVSRDELATRILTRSSLSRHRDKQVYFSSYRIVSTGSPGWWKPLAYSMLPDELSLAVDDALERRLGTALRPAPPPAPAKPAALSAAYPELRFAFTRKDRESGPVFRHAVGQDLAAAELTGLVLLARFHLNTFHRKTRSSLPVLFLDGRPHAFIGYRPSTKDDPTNVILHDGRRTIRLPFDQVSPRLSPVMAFLDAADRR